MVNQVETHIFNQQKEMKEWADKYDIRLEAWAPFGEGRGGTFENPVIAEIAEKYQGRCEFYESDKMFTCLITLKSTLL